MESNSPVKLSEEVTKAKADGIPIVCLESTVFSQLGLPSPSNAGAYIHFLCVVVDDVFLDLFCFVSALSLLL